VIETALERPGLGDEDMATIIAFPRDAAMRRAKPALSESGEPIMASVTILPVVRIERHDDHAADHAGSGQDAPPPRGRRRRARS